MLICSHIKIALIMLMNEHMRRPKFQLLLFVCCLAFFFFNFYGWINCFLFAWEKFFFNEYHRTTTSKTNINFHKKAAYSILCVQSLWFIRCCPWQKVESKMQFYTIWMLTKSCFSHRCNVALAVAVAAATAAAVAPAISSNMFVTLFFSFQNEIKWR